jgi:uncharacterized protein DUF1877
MARDVSFKYQYLTGISAAQVARLRSSPAELSKFLAKNPGHGLNRYWQAVPYLITGRATSLKEPLRWFTGGGEVLGRNDAGRIRYLSPDKVARLAAALADESPDELGHTHYDEAAMDEAGVYPGRWVQDGEDFDQLGTIRELYSYVRDFLMARKRDRKGVVIYQKEEVAFTEEEDEATPAAPKAPAPPAPAAAQAVGAVVLIGDKGRWYTRGDAAAHPKATPNTLRDADAATARLGYRHVGDFAAEGTDVLRAYVSEDGTVVAIAYFSDLGLGSWTFLGRLEGGALVVASDAFTQEVKKVKLFGLSLSKATPAALHASVLERRALLVKSHGAPVVLESSLRSAAHAWDSYGLKFRIGRRR